MSTKEGQRDGYNRSKNRQEYRDQEYRRKKQTTEQQKKKRERDRKEKMISYKNSVPLLPLVKLRSYLGLWKDCLKRKQTKDIVTKEPFTELSGSRKTSHCARFLFSLFYQLRL